MNKPIKAASWLVELINQKNTPRKPIGVVGKTSFLGDGHRNSDLTALAGFGLRKYGLGKEQLEDFLSTFNEAAPNPLSPMEIASIAQSVSRYSNETLVEQDEVHISAYLAEHLCKSSRHAIGLGWMWFNGRNWETDDGGKRVQEFTKTFVKSLYEAAKASSDPDGAKKARSLLSKTRVSNLNFLASSDPRVSIDASAFDSKPGLLNVQNGTIEFSSGNITLRQHDPADLLTKCAKAEYQPEATCPQFDDMMREILCPEEGKFAMRYMGYCASGSFDQQTFAIFHGPGANGKSTFINVLVRLLGDYALTVEPSTFMLQKAESIRNDIARLRGALVGVSSELGVGEMLNAPLLKRYVGGDPITARFLFKEYITFQPTAVPIFVTNALPIINGADQALGRRIVLLNFDRVIPINKRDPRLSEKLWQERSGILNRLLEGLSDYLSDQSLRMPASVSAAIERYITASDLIAQFINDDCDVATDGEVPAGALYEAYRAWCIDHGVKALSRPLFRTELEKREGISGKRTSKANVWCGLTLRTRK